MISLHRLKQSLTHALRGVRVVFVAEQSFRLQVIAAIAVVAAGFYFQVTSNEFVILMLLIGAILSLEMINSIFERIVDSFKPRIHPIVKDIKDIMAGFGRFCCCCGYWGHDLRFVYISACFWVSEWVY